jgi:glutathione synthase/RimK-type ligase-like ATP-grasp enzyme
MKKVLILFGKNNWRKSKPFKNEKYMYSYEYFYELCRKNGIQIYRASYQWYDYRKHIFKHAWIFEKKNGGWMKTDKIKPDLVFDKTKTRPEVEYKKSLIGESYKIFNNPIFTALIDNKLYTGHLFPEWTKGNQLIQNDRDLQAALSKVKGEKAVVKPLDLSGGENVIIGKKKEILSEVKKRRTELKNYIVQEFINSSRGIPGITKGVHDLRLVFINNRLIYSYYRKPAEGSLLANLAQGGTMAIVPLHKLPKNLKPIIKRAADIFSVYGSNIYTVDVMFDEKRKPWIVELNSMPGMYFEPGQEKTRKYFYKELLKVFKRELSI